jgi:hypothetical protein
MLQDKKVIMLIKKDNSNDLAPIKFELVNEDATFTLLKAAKALSKINKMNNRTSKETYIGKKYAKSCVSSRSKKIKLAAFMKIT